MALKWQVCFNLMNISTVCLWYSLLTIIVLLYVWCYLNPHHNLCENKGNIMTWKIYFILLGNIDEGFLVTN